MNYTYETLTQEQVQAYLERIGLGDLTPEERRPGRELLDRIIYAHQTHVPFEDLDPYFRRIPISLKVTDLYRKVVTEHRGGYCFELNGLLVALLRSLGFDAWSVMCRVVIENGPLLGISHEGVIARIDGVMHFCDVGFGGPMAAGALVVQDGLTQVIRGETFRPVDEKNGWWSVIRTRKGADDDYAPDAAPGETCGLMFMTALADPADFAYMNQAMYTRPDVRFVTTVMVNLRTPEGFRSITDMTWKEKVNGVMTVREIPSEEERDRLLAEKFGIRY